MVNKDNELLTLSLTFSITAPSMTFSINTLSIMVLRRGDIQYYGTQHNDVLTANSTTFITTGHISKGRLLALPVNISLGIN